MYTEIDIYAIPCIKKQHCKSSVNREQEYRNVTTCSQVLCIGRWILNEFLCFLVFLCKHL